jgi:hypothetical protein
MEESMSPQTDYSREMPNAVAGLQVDGRHDNFVASAAAEEVIRFGLMTVRKSDSAAICRLPGANVVVVTDDGGTWTAGDVVVTINGQSVTTSFTTNKATSMAAVATALQALGFVSTAVYTGGSDIITITATSDVYLAVSVSVAGITGTMTISGYTYTSNDAVLGLSTREAKAYGQSRSKGINDTAVATLSGDTITTSDTIDGTINGVAFSTVTYATSEANTLQLLCNELMKNSGVALATYTGRVVTVTNNAGLEIQLALTVTDNALASVAPSFAITYAKQATGVADTEAAYFPTETVSNTRKGSIWVRCEENVSIGDTPYVRVASGAGGSARGYFRNDDDSGTCQDVSGSFGSFVSNAVQDPDGSYVAQLEVNLP